MSVLQKASFRAERFFDLSSCLLFVTIPTASLPKFNYYLIWKNQTQSDSRINFNHKPTVENTLMHSFKCVNP